MQVAAMDHPIGRAEAPDRVLAEIEQFPLLSGIPDADFLGRRLAHQRPQAFFEAEIDQHAAAVGGDLDAGAQFPQFRRLFVDVDVKPALQKRKRGGQPADAGACDDHMQI